MAMKVDMLYFMLAVEFLLVFLASTFYLFFRNRKYRKLYQKAMKDLSEARTTEREIVAPKESPVEDVRREEPPAAPEEAQPQAFVIEDDADNGSLRGKIKKLQRIVNLQKDKILDLMCYKDFFEGAQKKLFSIQNSNQELGEKIRGLGETCQDKEEFAGAVSAFEKNNSDLGAFVNVLEKENVTLATKFSDWEEELRKLWEEAETSEGGDAGIDEGRHAELLKEKDELVARLNEFEEKLQDKSNQLEDMQKQYEDIEREYMILYKQQQQQQQSAQPSM